MLTGKLPNGDVAAEMLNAAHLEQPVKMQTPPNPAKCQQIIKGPFVKAATLAKSTDDPATLERLARHSALGVKLAVAQNPAANDAARRIVEFVALKRDDDEILTAVIGNASIEFLVDALEDPYRHDRYARILHDNERYLTSRLSDQENPATSAAVEAILRSDPKRFATTIGRLVGVRTTPGDSNVLADICAEIDSATEVRFLNGFVSSSPCIDDVVIDAFERIRAVAPDSVPVGLSTLRVNLRATSMTERGKSYLLQLGQATANTAYAIEPTLETLDVITRAYGNDIALRTALWTKTYVAVSTEVKKWMLGQMHTRTDDRIQMTCDANQIESILDAIEDDDLLVAALKAAPTHLTTMYLAGQYGEVPEHLARLVVPGAVEDVLRNLRLIESQPWAVTVMTEVVRTASLRDIFSNFHVSGIYLRNEHLESLLERVALEATDSATARRNGFSTRLMIDRLISPEFLEHIDRPDLPTATLLVLLRSAKSLELTMDFIRGARQRKMTELELNALLAEPGEAFNGGLLEASLRRIGDLINGLDIETVDRIVDAAGPEIITTIGQVHAPKFVEYLVDRISRNTGDADEWVTAFELLTKSSVPIGTALSGAKRLNKARNR